MRLFVWVFHLDELGAARKPPGREGLGTVERRAERWQAQPRAAARPVQPFQLQAPLGAHLVRARLALLFRHHAPPLGARVLEPHLKTTQHDSQLDRQNIYVQSRSIFQQ